MNPSGPQLDLFGEPPPRPGRGPDAAAAVPPPAPEDPPTLTVSELTRRIRGLLESRIGAVWVEGEISNLRVQSSGHRYFTLKDEGAALSAVLFRNAARGASALTDGLRVIAFGELSVYEPRGQYQLVIRAIQPVGAGELQARFDALKRRLDAEGLFHPARKRPIPRVPSHVVLVTSPSGAALQDMLRVLARRAPQLRVSLFPVRVQGAEAAPEIARALDRLAAWWHSGSLRPDTVIIARGGGSLEDLWPFNEEVVARALAASPIPTISGVGHEVDVSIADYVADLRAPTPSAAAEQLIEDRAVLLTTAHRAHLRLHRATVNRMARARLVLGRLAGSAAFREPVRTVRRFQQRLDELALRLHAAPGRLVATQRHRLALAASRFAARAAGTRLPLLRTRLAALAARLDLLSPDHTLARGYALVRDANGRVIRSAAALPAGTSFDTRFCDGTIRATSQGPTP